MVQKLCSCLSALALVGCASSVQPPVPAPAPAVVTSAPQPAPVEPDAVAAARCPEAWQQARAWAFSADGRVFAVAEPDRVEVFDTGTWTRRFALPLAWYAETLKLSDDGRWLFVWLWPPPDVAPAVLAVVDAKSGVEIGRREAGDHDVDQGFVAAPDGSWVAIAGHTTGIEPPRVERLALPGLGLKSFDPSGKATDPARPKWKPRTLPAGSRLANGDAEWNADRFEGAEGVRHGALLASADSSRLVIEWLGAEGAHVSVVDAAAGELLASLTGSDPHLGGEWLSVFRASGGVTLWNLQLGRGRMFYDPWCTPLSDRAAPVFAPGGGLVALPGHPRACLVETASATLKGTLPKGLPTAAQAGDYVVPTHWTSDGQVLLLRASRRLLMARRDGELLELPGSPEAVTNVPDESRIFQRAKDASLFWLGDSGFPALEWRASMLRELVVPNGSPSRTWVSPDGELFMREREQPITLRSTRDSTAQGSLVADGVRLAGFDPSGRWAVTSSADHELTVWKISNGHAELQIPGCLGESDE